MEKNELKEQLNIIGVNLRKQRKKKGLTQEQLADKCRNAPDNAKISDMENGKEDFLISTLLTLCHALDVSLSDVAKENTK